MGVIIIFTDFTHTQRGFYKAMIIGGVSEFCLVQEKKMIILLI